MRHPPASVLHGGRPALRTCPRVLERDGAVGILPEANRGAGEPATIRNEVAALALVTGHPSCR